MKSIVAAALFILALAPQAGVAAGAACTATDAASLRACVAKADDISLAADIQCQGAECCTAGTRQKHLPFLAIVDRSGKVIHGNGHSIRRRDPAQTGSVRACAALMIRHSSGITLDDLSFDEDPAVPPCAPADVGTHVCTSTVAVLNSDEVTFDKVRIHAAKTVALDIHGSRHVTVRNSEVADSGTLGIAVGFSENPHTPSEFFTLTGSKITGTRTNGLALGGLSGSRDGDNKVTGNTFSHNHWQGLWFSPGIKEASPGGQVYMPDAHYLDFSDNTISDGYCANCAQHSVSAVELGKAAPGLSLTHVRIAGNRISNQSGVAIIRNHDVVLDSTVRIDNNRMSGTLGMGVCFIRAAGGCEPGDANASGNQLTP